MLKYLKGLNQALFGWAWCPPRDWGLLPRQLRPCWCLTTGGLRLGQLAWIPRSWTDWGTSRTVTGPRDQWALSRTSLPGSLELESHQGQLLCVFHTLHSTASCHLHRSKFRSSVSWASWPAEQACMAVFFPFSLLKKKIPSMPSFFPDRFYSVVLPAWSGTCCVNWAFLDPTAFLPPRCQDHSRRVPPLVVLDAHFFLW